LRLDAGVRRRLQDAIEVEIINANAHVIDLRRAVPARGIRRQSEMLRSRPNLQGCGGRPLSPSTGVPISPR